MSLWKCRTMIRSNDQIERLLSIQEIKVLSARRQVKLVVLKVKIQIYLHN